MCVNSSSWPRSYSATCVYLCASLCGAVRVLAVFGWYNGSVVILGPLFPGLLHWAVLSGIVPVSSGQSDRNWITTATWDIGQSGHILMQDVMSPKGSCLSALCLFEYVCTDFRTEGLMVWTCGLEVCCSLVYFGPLKWMCDLDSSTYDYTVSMFSKGCLGPVLLRSALACTCWPFFRKGRRGSLKRRELKTYYTTYT